MIFKEGISIEANHITFLATDQAAAAMIVRSRDQTAETNDARSITVIPTVVAVGTGMAPLHNILSDRYR